MERKATLFADSTRKLTYPSGIRAVTSTLPYFTLTLSRVMSLALCTGLMIAPVLELDATAHCETLLDVHVPSVVRLRLYPLVIAPAPRTSSVSVGTM